MDQPLAGYDIPSGPLRGARIALHANRLVLHGGDVMETVPLAHLASVRVAFERDVRKLNWAIVLLAVALLMWAISSPLQFWMAELGGKVSGHANRESLEQVLLSVFSAAGQLARLLAPLAVFVFAGAVALAVLFWIGRTTMTLAFAATERDCSVRGRDRQLVDFAELLADRLATRKE